MNLINGKSYVGLTRRGLDQRWKEHVRGSRRPKLYVQYAIRKHGVDCWQRVVLQECEDLSGAKLVEIMWIKRLGTFGDDGYNGTPGGDAVGEFTEEMRKKISDAAKRRGPVSEETRRLMSEAAKNRPSPSVGTREKLRRALKGKTPSDETRQRMSEVARRWSKRPSPSDETRVKRSRSMQGKNAIAVDQLTLDGIFIQKFASMSEATRQTGVKNISGCCRGIRFNAGGFVWRYTIGEQPT